MDDLDKQGLLFPSLASMLPPFSVSPGHSPHCARSLTITLTRDLEPLHVLQAPGVPRVLGGNRG